MCINILDFCTRLIFDLEYKLQSSPFYNFLQPAVNYSLSDTNIFLSALLSNILSLCSLPSSTPM